jgi:hypothetical protein
MVAIPQTENSLHDQPQIPSVLPVFPSGSNILYPSIVVPL